MKIPKDIKELLAKTRILTDEELEELRKTAKELVSDVEFQKEVEEALKQKEKLRVNQKGNVK